MKEKKDQEEEIEEQEQLEQKMEKEEEHQSTSRTCFLEDLSLEAQPTEAPFSSTVYSGTIWEDLV